MVLFICIDHTDIPCKEKGTNARYLEEHQKDLIPNLLTIQGEFIGKIREKKWFSVLERIGTK